MMTAEKRKAGLQRSGEVSEEDEGKGIREGTEYEKGRHDQKEEKANKIRYKMVGVACFHCVPALFPLLLEKRQRSKYF